MGRPTLDKMSIADRDLRIVSLEAAMSDLLILSEIVARNAGDARKERIDLANACESARHVLFPIGDIPLPPEHLRKLANT